MSGGTPGGPTADHRRLVASSSVRKRGILGKVLRRRVPTAGVALVCVLGITAALTGAVSPMPVLDFVTQGHWVYNSVLRSALHIDGATAQVDAQAQVPGDPGSQVVQGESSGYVVGRSDITVFGKSSLNVEGSIAAPSSEVPLGLEVPGSPYLVYRNAGKVVRLGPRPVTITAGGPVGDPVFTADGTLWFHRKTTGTLCPLRPDADRIAECPASVPPGHTGALTVVGDRPMFLDTTAGALIPFGDNGSGAAVQVGLRMSAQARPAPTDVAGRVAILDPESHSMHLVDPAAAAAPITVDLPDGDYDGPTSTGAAVAVVDTGSNTVLTYDSAGKPKATKALPKNSGAPRLVRGEDSRVYVEGSAGTHVVVVAQDGGVTDVPVVAPSTEDKRKQAPPAGDKPANGQPERDERATPQGQPPSTEDNRQGNGEPTRDEPPPVPPSPPGAPTAVTATGADSSVTLSWGAAASNRAAVTGYRVTWSGGSTDVGGSARSTRITGLTNGTSYTFSVSAVNAEGRGPSASADPVVPGTAASAPRGLTATRSDTSVTVSWTAPADLGGGRLQHYTVSATGQTTKTVTGTSTTFSGLVPGATITFTVKAVTRTSDGQPRTGAGASKSVAIPNQDIRIEPGEASESANCETPACHWINVTLTGLEPNTTYSVHGWANGHEFTDPVDMRTDANGSATCADDSCDRIRYDVPDTDVYLFVELPSGQLKSNTLSWEAG